MKLLRQYVERLWNSAGFLLDAREITFLVTSAIVTLWGFFEGVSGPLAVLAGIVTFAALVTARNQRRAEDRRPEIALSGDRCKVEEQLREAGDKGEVSVKLRMVFANHGNSPAHRLRCRAAFCDPRQPGRATRAAKINAANKLYPSQTFGIDIQANAPVKRAPDEPEKWVVGPTDLLVHCEVRYSDAAEDGREYSDDMWYIYRLQGAGVADATKELVDKVKPYIDALYAGDEF